MSFAPLQLAQGLQGVGEGDGVHGNAAPDQILDTLENDPMSGTEEVLGPNTHDHFFGVEIVKRQAILRDLVFASAQINALAYDAPDDVNEVVEEAEKMLLEVTEKRVSST